MTSVDAIQISLEPQIFCESKVSERIHTVITFDVDSSKIVNTKCRMRSIIPVERDKYMTDVVYMYLVSCMCGLNVCLCSRERDGFSRR